MKPDKETAEQAKADSLETIGGDYHRLESTFQPREKAPPARPREKGRARDKTARKPIR